MLGLGLIEGPQMFVKRVLIYYCFSIAYEKDYHFYILGTVMEQNWELLVNLYLIENTMYF